MSLARVVPPASLAVAAFAAAVLVPGTQAFGQQPLPPSQVRGIYLRDCAVCHAPDGSGTNRGPSIVGVGAAFTDYELSTGRMPLGDPGEKTRRKKPAYSPSVVRQLVDYVTAFGPGGLPVPRTDPAAGDVAAGGAIYRLQCAACHAWAGGGGALLHREAPSLASATPTQIAEAVRVGPDTMPAFGTAAIADRDLDSLVAYVRYLDRPRNRGGEALGHLGPLAEGAVGWIVGIGLLVLLVRWIGESV